jgi:hypothetical protein
MPNKSTLKGRCWKAKRPHKKTVVGLDVELGVIPEMLGKTIVGRFCGKTMNPLALWGWLNENLT